MEVSAAPTPHRLYFEAIGTQWDGDVSRSVHFASTTYKGSDRTCTVAPASQPSAAVQFTLSRLADNNNG
jgi:hypothetical protein